MRQPVDAHRSGSFESHQQGRLVTPGIHPAARAQFFASTERSSGGRDWRRVRPPLLLSGEWSLLGLRFLVVISQALDAVQRRLEHQPAEVSLRVAARQRNWRPRVGQAAKFEPWARIEPRPRIVAIVNQLSAIRTTCP